MSGMWGLEGHIFIASSVRKVDPILDLNKGLDLKIEGGDEEAF